MEFLIHPIECGADVVDFPVAIIVFALTQPRSAEVEAQHGKAKTVQRFHGVKDNLVMQRPAKQRVRVADDRRVRCVLSARVEQSFKASSGTIEKE